MARTCYDVGSSLIYSSYLLRKQATPLSEIQLAHPLGSGSAWGLVGLDMNQYNAISDYLANVGSIDSRNPYWVGGVKIPKCSFYRRVAQPGSA